MSETTAIPVNPTTLKRGDIIRVRTTPNESQDVRVTGVKSGEFYGTRCRVNYMDSGGARRSWWYFMSSAGGPEERYACKVVSVESIRADPATEGSSAAPWGYLMDEAGDIAYREGDVGAWLRVGGWWAGHPRLFWWSSEPATRRWRVL